jgi:hypothetical protein
MKIERGSPLLSESGFWARVVSALAAVSIVILLSLVAVAAVAARIGR